MEKPTKQGRLILLAVVSLVIFAYLCRAVPIPNNRDNILLRTVIYSVLYTGWGFSLYLRMTHPQVRRYTVCIAVLMVFWLVVRMVKYRLPDGFTVLTRYLWYLYYLPLLCIPVLVLLAALSIGMPETERLPKKAALLPVSAALLFLTVLTNDLHLAVFTFPYEDMPRTDKYGRHAVGYYLIAAYILLVVLAVFITLTVKCRTRGRRLFPLPCIPVLLLAGYAVSYNMGFGWVKVLLGDMPALYCVLYATAFELCVRCGLIRSNSGYRELFLSGSHGAQITDPSHTVCLSAADAPELTAAQIADAETHPVLISGTTLLRSRPIRFGHVLWQEDISELTEAIAQIEENCQDLAERNSIRRKNLAAEQKILALQEKNRITDLLHLETAAQIDRIDRLLTQYGREEDPAERRRLLAGAAVMGSYIKRYGNLLLVSERSDTGDIRDLARCFEESFRNLELLNADCLCTLAPELTLRTKDMLRVYRTFEAILEDCLFELEHVWVSGRERNGQAVIRMDFVCACDLSRHACEADGFSCDPESTRFTFRLEKGGAEA